jgi:hypothetical protein
MGMPAQPQETQGRRASSMPVERPLIAFSTSEIRRSQAVAPTPQGGGGTLHQHLPDVVGVGIAHRQPEPGRQTTHWVMLEPSSKVRQIVKRSRTKVISFHHQAIARLGGGLTATGWRATARSRVWRRRTAVSCSGCSGTPSA